MKNNNTLNNPNLIFILVLKRTKQRYIKRIFSDIIFVPSPHIHIILLIYKSLKLFFTAITENILTFIQSNRLGVGQKARGVIPNLNSNNFITKLINGPISFLFPIIS